ncbi:LytTR family DNA-binding domain-containing protein [Tissierella pigra]|uniref:Response regulator transcription factor n=1 Tax=Tissierella pigra TaxID=2607614 RepID=A0A6N7XYJ1_9FIRM|nr:LytTR family DNA-binding domain-containing protein [Tissierella pigra]MBU5428310.1 LytTR family DNA-binding domain-containing protein [Tissierella pigra]MSU01634.1 response regulator transcription factor [Tissierella pigra]
MSQIVNIAICDDEKVQVELLKKYVKNWETKNNLKVNIECFYSGESFEFSWSMDKKYNILLLDIEMSGINGVDLAKKIRTEDNLLNIVFITAISDYIGEGYEVDAINYLIKPIIETKLYECLDKSVKKIHMEEKILLIDVEGKITRIKEKDIIYIEAFSHSIDIHTIDGIYTTRKNIGVIEKELDAKLFIRCHRSYIVGLKHIKRIGKTDIELDNKETIPVSRRLYSKVNKEFIRYFRGEVDE